MLSQRSGIKRPDGNLKANSGYIISVKPAWLQETLSLKNTGTHVILPQFVLAATMYRLGGIDSFCGFKVRIKIPNS